MKLESINGKTITVGKFKYYNDTPEEVLDKHVHKARVGSEEGKWVCPVCGNIVYKSYCDYCGQRLGWEAVLDWEEDDNG